MQGRHSVSMPFANAQGLCMYSPLRACGSHGEKNGLEALVPSAVVFLARENACSNLGGLHLVQFLHTASAAGLHGTASYVPMSSNASSQRVQGAHTVSWNSVHGLTCQKSAGHEPHLLHTLSAVRSGVDVLWLQARRST